MNGIPDAERDILLINLGDISLLYVELILLFPWSGQIVLHCGTKVENHIL